MPDAEPSALDHDAIDALADAFFSAITGGNVEGLREIYAPTAVIWHNDGAQQTVDENLAFLSWLTRNTKSIRFENARRQPTPGGFVEQHVLRGTTRDDAEFEADACLVFTLEGDRITRMDEYLDPSTLAPIGAMIEADGGIS